MQKIYYILISLLLSSSAVYAGGWLQGKNNSFIKLNQSIIRGDQFYNAEAKQTQIITTGIYQTSLYVEHGISDKFDGVFYMPLLSRLTLNDVRFSSGNFQQGDEFTSVGDAQLGLKYGIRQGKSLVVAASLILGIPSGTTDGGRTELLQTGDGEFNQLIMVEAGYGFKFPMYANVGLGFNNRTKGFSEEIRLTAELGYTINKKLNLAIKFATIQSLMNGEPDGSAGNGIFSNNLEFVSFSPEVSYKVTEKFGFSFTLGGATSGRFILAEPSYNFGIFWDLKR